MLVLGFFVLGLIIGSFLNVVVLRIESDETLGGRSKCPSCGALIRWFDNVPVVSYFILGRRCRYCRASISWQYPAVELLTGILFAFFGSLEFGSGAPADLAAIAWTLFLVALLTTIAVYDARNMEIPLILLVLGIGGAIVYAFASSALAPFSWTDGLAPWRSMLFGGGLAAFVFSLLVYFSKETWMGMGDAWLAGIAGAAVGFPALLLLFTLSFSTGALVGGALMLSGKRGMKSQIPFAPFLAFATLATLAIQALDPEWLFLVLLPV